MCKSLHVIDFYPFTVIAKRGSEVGVLRALTVVQFLCGVVNVNVGRLAVDRPPEVVSAVLGSPDVAVRVERERDLVTQAVAQNLALGVVVVAVGRHRAHVEHLDDGAPDARVDGRVVPVRGGADGDDDQVRVLGGDGDGPRRVDALAHAVDDGLLAGDGHGDGVVRPRPGRGLGAGVEGLAVGRKAETVVETGALEEGLGAVDASVGAEGVDRDTHGGLQYQHVAQRVEEDGSRLTKTADDLGGLPAGIERERVSGRRHAGAGGWEWECRNTLRQS